MNQAIAAFVPAPEGLLPCKDLGLSSKNVTFFGSHAEADVAHMQQIEEALEKFVSSPQDQELVTRVASTTLFLTGQLLEQVAQRHR